MASLGCPNLNLENDEFLNKSAFYGGSFVFNWLNVLYKKDHGQENGIISRPNDARQGYSMHRLRTKFPLKYRNSADT